MDSSAVRRWVEDSLHDVLGYSDAAVAEYVVALARKSATQEEVLRRLREDGALADASEDGRARMTTLVRELFRRLGKTLAQATRDAEATRNAALARQLRAAENQSRYELIDEDVGEAPKKQVAATRQSEKRDYRRGGDEYIAGVGHGETKEERRERKRLRRERRERESRSKEQTALRRTRVDEPGRRASQAENGQDGRDKTRNARSEGRGDGETDERDRDIEERDAFAERLRKRDTRERVGGRHGGESERSQHDGTEGTRTQDSDGRRETSHAQENVEDDETVQRLRELSRRTYLKRREAKELERLRQEIEDERLLFREEELTERERKDLALKEELFKLASTRVNEALEDDPDDPASRRRVARYRMPDAYGEVTDERTDQEKRMDALTARFEDTGPANHDEVLGTAHRGPTTEQARWEDEQLQKARLDQAGTSGQALAAQAKSKYEFVMDDIAFMPSDILPAKGTDHTGGMSGAGQSVGTAQSVSPAMDERQKMKAFRESLPTFRYRDQLLDAIKRYQVIIVVSETGSGKTTQIPQYLVESGFGRIACTQPRRVAAMSVAARVAEEMGVRLGAEVGYSIRFEDCTSDKTVIKYMTDGMLLREFLSEPDLASYKVLIVDEAHERSLSTDIAMGLVKDIARFRGDDMRVIISSATLNAEKFSNYFDKAPVFHIPGRAHAVEVLYAKTPQSDYVDACCVTVLQIHASQPQGDILVFLTGQDEIEAAEESLRERTRGLGSKLGEIIIAPIYATLPSEQQAKIFEPTPEGARKVVLATNIAETSVTIPGIVYVIDPGFCKQKSYNPKTGMESLFVVPVSQAGAIQRAGRAGRTQPGKCFRLYTKWSFENEMEHDTVPEILRTNLAQVILMLMSLGIDNLLEFDFVDAPPVDVLSRSLEQLYALGALNDRGQLTKLGRRMAELPLDPMMAKALIASETYKCSDEVATICAMLSVNNAIFYRPKDKKLLADAAHAALGRGARGDHIKLLNCYNQWRDSGFSTQWCYENFVQARNMKKARDVREQLDGLLERVEVSVQSVGVGNPVPFLKALTAGFFYNGCKLQKSGQYRTLKNPHTVQVHPSSMLAKSESPPRWLIYHELVYTSKEFMRQVFEIEPAWLLEVAPHYYKPKELEDASSRKMPKARP